ncbi:NAD-dependent epimerase/dehydratase family protein [Pseudonocardia sp. TRM90224]|uniref:NAD-dependent epimerase/dehydratase family protein n=1 Tax=Pseudonocardia sp. TRM90224 TaxID=2812678 RepID=UPI001E2CA506|nr:NAD-dependent epimerase/dehydratase family protein [Pseudonocardia sp. TRM90224]
MLMVTGAAGFLGSTLVELLLREGREVRAVVRNPEAARRVLPAGVDIVVAHLSDVHALERAARGCTGVLHLAAAIGHSAEENRQSNVEGTRSLLAAVRAAGVPRLVYTSSGAALIDKTGLVSERPVGPPALTDSYSASKAEAEDLVMEAVSDGLRATVVCPGSVYGKSPRGPQSYNELFLAAARGEVTEVVDAAMAWVLAEDVAKGHLLALDHGEPGRRYLLCGEVAPAGRVVRRFAELVGGQPVRALPLGSSLGPDATTFARRTEVYGHIPPMRVDDAGAKALGFRPAGIEEGLARTAEWLLPIFKG